MHGEKHFECMISQSSAVKVKKDTFRQGKRGKLLPALDAVAEENAERNKLLLYIYNVKHRVAQWCK